MLCPVRALTHYLELTSTLRKDRQLFVCYMNGSKLGAKTDKQSLSRWIRDTIYFAYKQKGQQPPKGNIKAHSTRAVAASLAEVDGVDPDDLCRAATWSSLSVFATFYRLDMAAEKGLAPHVLAAAVASRSDRYNR